MKKTCLGAFVVAALGAAAVPAQESPAWLLVRSEAPSLASFDWKKLAQVYLKSDYRIVRAADANQHPASSRLVAGTPRDNALVAKLAKTLGITYRDKQVHYDGRQYPDNAGLAIVTDDPDGGGTLVLFTGATEQGAYNCLSVNVDTRRHGYVAMTFQKELHRRTRTAPVRKPLRVAGDVLRLVRLDEQLWRIRDELGDSLDEAALHISRAFAGYEIVFQRAVRPDINLLDFTRDQLRRHTKTLDATRKRFAGVDLANVLDGLDRMVTKALGGRKGPRPVVHVIVTVPDGTNAQVIGQDPNTGRMRMTLNLAAFTSLDALRLAATHELVHTLQSGNDGTLLGRSIHEGVATFVSQQLIDGTKDHEALMWSEAKLAAAKRHRRAILAAFTALQGSRDIRKTGPFVYLGTPLRSVPGAPDRCGYYVGFLAASAWRASNAERPLADLLATDAKTIFAALRK